MRTALLLGCGHDRRLIVRPEGVPAPDRIVTLDMNPDVGADIVHDLNRRPLPVQYDSFDEVHAYDVIEHLGAQGDWLGFFVEWEEYWRILKPGGLFCATVPRCDGVWAWGDPGHTRIINEGTLSFLSQAVYAAECRPGGTNRTDYRRWWRGDFDVVATQKINQAQLGFVLRAVKPARGAGA